MDALNTGITMDDDDDDDDDDDTHTYIYIYIHIMYIADHLADYWDS